MNLQDKIKERYALISEKMAFLTACENRKGFHNVRGFLDTRNNTKEEKLEGFLAMIETQLAFDEKIKQIKVQNYKIISDENFS